VLIHGDTGCANSQYRRAVLVIVSYLNAFDAGRMRGLCAGLLLFSTHQKAHGYAGRKLLDKQSWIAE
jgi:hypothetical protein